MKLVSNIPIFGLALSLLGGFPLPSVAQESRWGSPDEDTVKFIRTVEAKWASSACSPRLLVLWGKYDLSFEVSEPEAYRRDVPKAEVHVLDAGHFALDTAADEIAALIRGFVGPSR